MTLDTSKQVPVSKVSVFERELITFSKLLHYFTDEIPNLCKVL